MKKTNVSTPRIKKKIKRNTKQNSENTPQSWSKLAMAAACFFQIFEVIEQISFKITIIMITINILIMVVSKSISD